MMKRIQRVVAGKPDPVNSCCFCDPHFLKGNSAERKKRVDSNSSQRTVAI